MAQAQILWFRQDLRLSDQRALAAAAAAGPVLPVYVLDDETPGAWRMGGAQRWWLHHSLGALARDLARLGAPLLLRRGRAGAVIPALAAQVGAGAVHAQRLYEPWGKVQEAEVAAAATLYLHEGQTLAPPATITTGSGTRYRIFTPFWRALQDTLPPERPLAAPERLEAVPSAPSGERLKDWALTPTRPDWAGEFSRHWQPGEAGARAALEGFLALVEGYHSGRNLPAEKATSALSPHLHMGEISPATVWHAVSEAAPGHAEPFLREVGWRDFAIGTIDAFPDFAEVPGRAAFRHFPHRHAPHELRRWQRGETGYPIVDAGLRQMWRTGWMHNRVRMIAASFLVKHLLIDWREGERWFWDCLVDADLGNNSLGWQWIMGSGVDAQPFYRVFEPVGQGRRHDPEGTYVRRWVPELAALPPGIIHAPWEATAEELERAGVRLGETYPEPMVAHAEGRRRALEAYAQAKAAAGGDD